MNEHADQPASPGNQPGIPGQTLQSQREAMGWTVEQVADQLKLAPRQVVALEAGDYAALPSPAVTRGFVRAYAKLLRIDAAPLVSMIELNMPPEAQAGANASASANLRREQRPATFSETRFPIAGRRNRVPLGWIAAVVVVAGVAVGAWQLGAIPGTAQHAAAEANHALENPVGINAPGAASSGVATPTAGSQQDQLLNPSVPLISVPSPAGEGAPTNPAPAAAPGAAPATTAPAAPVTTPTPTPAPAGSTPTAAATPAPALATPVAATLAPVAAPAAAGANTLVLTVRADSWIQVTPAGGGRPLISRLVKAGSTETVEVSGPATLTVGAPGGVSATLRGANVPLPQQPGKTVARVALK